MVLVPIVILMVLLVAVQTLEPSWRNIRFDMHKSVSNRKSAIAFILFFSLLLGLLIALFGGNLNFIALAALISIIGLFFGSLYFVMVRKEHYAIILLMLSMPVIDFVEWDMGKRSGLFNISFGQISLSVKGAHIYIVSLFGVWVYVPYRSSGGT